MRRFLVFSNKLSNQCSSTRRKIKFRTTTLNDRIYSIYYILGFSISLPHSYSHLTFRFHFPNPLSIFLFFGHELADFGFYSWRLMLPNVGFPISVFINFTQFRNYTGFYTDYFDGRNIKRFKLIQVNRSNLKHSRRFCNKAHIWVKKAQSETFLPRTLKYYLASPLTGGINALFNE